MKIRPPLLLGTLLLLGTAPGQAQQPAPGTAPLSPAPVGVPLPPLPGMPVQPQAQPQAQPPTTYQPAPSSQSMAQAGGQTPPGAQPFTQPTSQPGGAAPPAAPNPAAAPGQPGTAGQAGTPGQPGTPATAGQPGTPAEPATPAPPPAQPPWVPRQTGTVRVLDKISAQAVTLTLNVGQSVTRDNLTLTLRACLSHPPDVPPDSAAYLDILDSKLPDTDFHGWMFANEPGLGMFTNPTLDVRLTACHD